MTGNEFEPQAISTASAFDNLMAERIGGGTRMGKRTKRKPRTKTPVPPPTGTPAPTTAKPRWYASPLFLGLLSIGGIVVAVVSLVISKSAFDQDGRALDASLTPRVNVVSYEASTASDIPMELSDGDGETTKYTGNAAAVDVVVENLHDQPELITRIDVRMRAVHRITACGGGPLGATARYDVVVPLDDNPAGKTFSLKRLHKVPGKDKDRFAVVVGPDRANESDLVQIFHFDIVLVLQSGGSLRADDIMLISPPVQAEDNDRVVTTLGTLDGGFNGSRECLLMARDQVDEAVRAKAKQQSPQIADLHAKLHAVGY